MTEGAKPSEYAGPAILELMGRTELAGMVREVTIAGAGFLRVDIPSAVEGQAYATQFVSPAALYRLTPCSEEAMLVVARRCQPQPVKPWELPHRPEVPTASMSPTRYDDDDDDFRDRDERDR